MKNFNISQGRVNRQFALGKQFYELPLEEKEKDMPEGLDQGKFNGYIPAGRRIINLETGLRDKTEMYNIPKFISDFPHIHPELIWKNLLEIEEFARVHGHSLFRSLVDILIWLLQALHTEVLDPLFVLLAIALELPEDYFTKIHQYSEKSEDHLRYMKYSKYSLEENKSLDNWGYGHTDLALRG
ncbi:MAG: hypothetical protein NXY57DRAFT_1042964 [Lentinula lateritia]|nr:MAG: hypothetical protein NXY57DRAFT_1042964 [Lentinula lateritia]